MTTIKSILGWLFGIYKRSPLLQGMLAGVAILHVALLLVFYFAWLAGVLNRWTA